MHLSKFFDTFSLKTSFTPKFTELLDKGSESILLDNPLPNILPRIENNFSKHIDISTPSLKILTFAGNELLTKAESWILLIYYFLKTHEELQETFLILIQQILMFRVTGKRKLKRYLFKCCKQLFTKDEAIYVINANPCLTNQISQNISDTELTRLYSYFLANPNFFEEQTTHTRINILSKGVYYYEKENITFKRDKVLSTSASASEEGSEKEEENNEGDGDGEMKLPKIRSVKLRKKIERKRLMIVINNGEKKKRGRKPKNRNAEMECGDENKCDDNKMNVDNNCNSSDNCYQDSQYRNENKEELIKELKQFKQTQHVITHSEMCISNQSKNDNESESEHIVNLLKTTEVN